MKVSRQITVNTLDSLVEIADVESGVEVHIDSTGKKVWVNVDGVCIARISKLSAKYLIICDDRSPELKKKQQEGE